MPPPLQLLPGKRRTIDLLPNEREIGYERVLFFLNQNRKTVLGLVLVLVLGIAVWGFWRYQENKTLKNAERNLAEANTPEAYESLAHDFPNADAAWIALMTAGDLYFQQAQFDKAEAAYRGVLDHYPKSALAPSALVGLAAILEIHGKMTEAIREYQRVWADYPHVFQEAQARFAAARLLEESGKIQEARRGYEDLAVFCPQSIWKSEASMRAKRLTAQLAGNAPKAKEPKNG